MEGMEGVGAQGEVLGAQVAAEEGLGEDEA